LPAVIADSLLLKNAVLHFARLSQEKLAILEGIELQHADQYFPTLQENLQCCKTLIANFEKETEDCYDFGF
jgi:hypothetical protein